jgi:hypothetical protein
MERLLSIFGMTAVLALRKGGWASFLKNFRERQDIIYWGRDLSERNSLMIPFCVQLLVV